MSGLQGSKCAPSSRDNKPKDNSSYVSVPNFGFVLLPLKPKAVTAVPTKAAPSPASPPMAPTKTAAPAPDAVKMPTEPLKLFEMTDASPASAEPEKQLTPAEVAGAQTRARMAEIMGPRRPQATSSGNKGQGCCGSWQG